MRIHTLVWRLGLGLMAAAVPACHRAAGAGEHTAQPAAVTDSLAGTVQVRGTEAFAQVVLTPRDGTAGIELVGPPSLRRIAGLDVTVFGTRSGTRFTVARFLVVAANGLPAVDGMLSATGDQLFLTTASGQRYPLVSPPPGLRTAVGHRVWVSGPLDHEAVAYGVIE